MSKEITEKIKDSVNQWLSQLKEKHPELHLTSQWKTLFPKGYRSGNNVVPVVTGTNQGKYLIAEVRFHLPDTLELDPDSIELIVKDEPFQETGKTKVSPTPLDEPLQILNEMVSGINEFLSGLGKITFPNQKPLPVFPFTNASPMKENFTPRKILIQEHSEDLEELKKEMSKSSYLPEWLSAISFDSVKDELLQKLAEGYAHYCRQVGRKVSLKDFFTIYTTHLMENKKLHHYCPYKAKSISLDENNWCTETYCSKKPYKASCSYPVLRFGAPSD